MILRRRSRPRFALLFAVTLLGPTLGWTAPAQAAVTAGPSSSGGSSISRKSITLVRPAGTVAGQVMLASIVSNDDSSNFTAPAGWTQVRNDSIVGVLRQAVYVKVAGSSEPSSYTWSLPDYRRLAGGITTYSGVDTGNPVHAHDASINSVSSTTVAIPSVTTSVPDAHLVALTAVNAEGTLSPPAGMTERWEASSPNSSTTRDALASASDGPQAATGSTATRTATATQPGRSIGALIALTPAAAPGADTTPPQTTITSGPSGDVGDTSATFAFAGNEPATFECQLDTAPFAACTSPKTYTGLALGTHTFTVRATDTTGNIEDSSESRTWTIVNAPDPVLVGAGDIAVCGGSGDERTADLLDGIAGTVFTIGDNVYNYGTAAEFNNCYGPSWGRHKARTRPAPGNHEYRTAGASAYFDYFGAAAGDPAKGYYDYRLGAWHVIVLNSECDEVACSTGSAQEQWLRRVLEASTADCTVAIWHHPRFSSAQSTGSRPEYQPFWQALYDHGADVVLSGHDHFYERFGLQSPTGAADAVHGIRQFTVGTGGKGFHSFGTPLPNSQVRNRDTFGVLKLTLHSNSYDWQFVPQVGKTFTDSGATACHGGPSLPPPPTPPGPDTTPPQTSITSGPSGTVTDTSATFAFTADEPSTFTCRLDNEPATACTSPVTYTGLSVATHTFTVTATDTSLNHNTDPDPAVRTWTIATGSPAALQGVIQTAAGTVRGFAGDGGPATDARLAGPRTMATDAAGNMFVVDTGNHRVRRIDAATGVITTIAGTGVAGFSGDGGPATAAQLNTANGIAVAHNGAVYVADTFNHRIRRVANGVITTVAGTGSAGYNGDNIAATAARLRAPKGVEFGPDGHLYIADANNHRVRRLDLSTGVITTVAGRGTAGYSGDGGSATAALLRTPRNTAFDGAGGLYIADGENFVVRRVNLSTGVITTVAGSGIAGFSGDGGPATAAQLGLVRDVAVDTAGNVYIADEQNHRVRVVTPDGVITTLAGTGVAGYSGDGGPADRAQIRGPRGVAVDASGRILIGDTGNNRIRRVTRP